MVQLNNVKSILRHVRSVLMVDDPTCVPHVAVDRTNHTIQIRVSNIKRSAVPVLLKHFESALLEVQKWAKKPELKFDGHNEIRFCFFCKRNPATFLVRQTEDSPCRILSSCIY